MLCPKIPSLDKQSLNRSREEKSLRHIVMVAEFLDDNKPKTSLKKWIRTVSNVHRSYSISFDLSNVREIIWGWIRKDLKV